MGGTLRLFSALGALRRSSGIRCGSLLTSTCTAGPLTRSLRFTFTLAIDLVEIYQFDKGSLGIITYAGPQLDDVGIPPRTTCYLGRNSREKLRYRILILQIAEHYSPLMRSIVLGFGDQRLHISPQGLGLGQSSNDLLMGDQLNGEIT